MSLLGIEGMHFQAYHGFYNEENIIGSTFIVDVYISASLENASQSDKIKDTINYEGVYAICSSIMNEKYDLIEKVGGEIISHLLPLLSKGDNIKVRVRKMNPILSGVVKSTFIELDRIK